MYTIVGAYKEGPDLFHTVFCPDIKSLIYASIAWSVFFLKMDIQPDIQALNNSDQMELKDTITSMSLSEYSSVYLLGRPTPLERLGLVIISTEDVPCTKHYKVPCTKH